MIALIQRVSEAAVIVDGETIASIGPGVLALIGVERGDTPATAGRLGTRLLAYRIFPDADGRMNLAVSDIGGGVLLVPQFTLAADTDRGNRPSFGHAAEPHEGKRLFDLVVEEVSGRHSPVATGRFGAEMHVRLVNHGPVTFRLRVRPGP
jgi:D-tyrosyl-tRNA(Tyr) deacylase